MQIDALAALARDGAADDVDDAQDAAALALDLLHRRQGVERLARLADGDIERVPLDDGIAVAELRRGLGLRRECARASRSGARRCAPAIYAAPHPRIFTRRTSSRSRAVEREAAEMRRLEARIQPSAEGSPHRLGLLGDLLPHVVGELALVEGLVLPRDRRAAS